MTLIRWRLELIYELGSDSHHFEFSTRLLSKAHGALSAAPAWRPTDTVMPSKRTSNYATTDPKAGLWRVVHVLRRLLVVTAVVYYIVVSLNATVASVIELNYSADDKSMGDSYFSVPLIGAYAGTTTVRESPVLLYLLGNDTAPRNDTLYLDYVNKAVVTNNIGCSATLYVSATYDNAFLRTMLATLVADTSYNHTFLADLELVVPVVDCTYWPITYGRRFLLRLTYVMRSITDPDDVYFLAFQLSTQDYWILAENRAGTAAVVMFSYFNDMRLTDVANYFAISIGYPFSDLSFEPYEYLGVDNYYRWRLRNIANLAGYVKEKEVVTATRDGFYNGEEAVQSSIKYTYTVPETTPLAMLAKLHWVTGAVLNDSWAWVHLIHLYFAGDTLFNLLILLVLVVRNDRKNGEVWIGDAFASISKALLPRSLLVVLTWVVDKFWMAREYAIYDANIFWGLITLDCPIALIQADLLTLYLGFASLVGLVLHERIDPAFVIVNFTITFANRDDIMRSWSSVVAYLVNEATKDFELSGLFPDSSVSDVSPLNVWTTHSLPAIDFKFMLAPLLPVCVSMTAVLAYALLRKFYYHVFPPVTRVIQGTAMSDPKELLVSQKGNYTIFEIATGAALQEHYGVVSDYENCVVRKGVKYASADGIYCSGYVIAGGRFLVATEDLLAILLMKLSRLRFTNVYVHEVKDKSVEMTGRLVYSYTITWADLLNLSIGMLA